MNSGIPADWKLIPTDNSAVACPLTTLRKSLASPNLYSLAKNIDWTPARLPVLLPAQFTDPNKGMWELWGQPPEVLEQLGTRARNPALDVSDANVAIDFGTSSTVVAIDKESQHELLRIGVRNYDDECEPAHYENPTVLEFLDLQALWTVWNHAAYRPPLSWDDVRCSHEALQNLRNNKTDPKVLASTLVKLKQWALRGQQEGRLLITDQRHALEHELTALTDRRPVKGQPIAVDTDYPFDPLELYAWFLGTTINWRGRGIFLRYYMSFPVKYPREVKQRILASFARGLQRSLPLALTLDDCFQKFTVEERASEPAAYAAAALPAHGIAPTQAGVPYAIFDFGGGTADFDFGYYRLPTEQEEDAGLEEILDQLHASGDNFLGGENLLENLAYRVFQDNLDVCRTHKITFTRPPDAADFPGSELFIDTTQAAATNSLMLMTQLRPLWESGALEAASGGVRKLSLLTRDGSPVTCELAVQTQPLLDLLRDRVLQGVHNFLEALRAAFSEQSSLPDTVHVLLAGNASRSQWVLGLFGLSEEGRPLSAELQAELQEMMQSAQNAVFGDQAITLKPYLPLPINPQDVYQPTAKTGVALGLLRLCPGNPVKVVQRAIHADTGEAPFAYFVGGVQQGLFKPALKQGMPYHQWQDLGPVRMGVFFLRYTSTPKALSGNMPANDKDLRQKNVKLADAAPGQRLFARVVGPSDIELCSGTSLEAIQADSSSNLQRMALG